SASGTPLGTWSLLDIGRGSQRVEPGYTAISVGTTTDVNGTNFAATSFTSPLDGDGYTVAISNLDQTGAAVGGIDWRECGAGPAGSLVMAGEDHLKNTAGVIRVTLGSVPAGTYSVVAYHLDPTPATQAATINVFVNSGSGFSQVTPPGTPGNANLNFAVG